MDSSRWTGPGLGHEQRIGRIGSSLHDFLCRSRPSLPWWPALSRASHPQQTSGEGKQGDLSLLDSGIRGSFWRSHACPHGVHVCLNNERSCEQPSAHSARPLIERHPVESLTLGLANGNPHRALFFLRRPFFQAEA